MTLLLLEITVAVFLLATIWLGHEAAQLRKINKILKGVVEALLAKNDATLTQQDQEKKP